MTFLYAISFDGHQLEVVSSSYPLVAWNPNPVWGDTLEVQSIVGTPDNVIPIVADPQLVIGHTYRINFFEGLDSGNTLWRLVDYTIGNIILDSLEIVTSPNYPYPVVDGIQWQVHSPPLAIKDWDWEDGVNSPLYPDYADGRWISGNDWGGGALFGGLGMAHIFWGEDPGIARADFPTVEFRFTFMTAYDDTSLDGRYTFGTEGGEPYYFNANEGQGAFMYLTFATGSGNYNGFNNVPFQCWDVKSDPPRQLNVVVRDRDGNTRWDLGTGEGPYNYVWVLADDYDPTGEAWDPANGGDHDFMNLLLSGPIPSYYVLWGVQRGDCPFLAMSGVLTCIPYYHSRQGDILQVVSPLVGIDDQTMPFTFFLHQNYPNPFNPETHIRFGLIQKMKVELTVYNVLGQQVKKLINQEMPPGEHELTWDGRNDLGTRVSTGIYYYRFKAGDNVKCRKMVLMK